MKITLRQKATIIMSVYLLVIGCFAVRLYDILTTKGEEIVFTDPMIFDISSMPPIMNVLLGGMNGVNQFRAWARLLLVSVCVSGFISARYGRYHRGYRLFTVRDYDNTIWMNKLFWGVSVLVIIVLFTTNEFQGLFYIVTIFISMPVNFYGRVYLLLKRESGNGKIRRRKLR